MKYKLNLRSTKAALELSVKEILESFNMFKGTNLILNSDLAQVSTQVNILLYIFGLKAGDSSDTSMSTCDGVGHIKGHWKINKTLAPLLLIGGVVVTNKLCII